MISHFTAADERLLLDLLSVNTVTPVETGTPSDLDSAHDIVVDAARDLGFEVVFRGPPSAEAMRGDHVPIPVLERYGELGEAFLTSQPNVVLRRGPSRSTDDALVFNMHLDTVDGFIVPRRVGGRVFGRGAIDAKGLAVGTLAGIRAALPHLDTDEAPAIILQLVGGEEGGAIGVYGTRELVRLGFVGKLNIVLEPTRLTFLDCCTASMTLEVRVDGRGSTDEEPELGTNATIALASLTDRMVRELAPRLEELPAKLCIGGVTTGSHHNRVYGTGRLLVNFAYGSVAIGERVEELVAQWLDRALDGIRADFISIGVAAALARDVRRVVGARWLKRRMPVLDNRKEELERVLRRAGIQRATERNGVRPFTTDGIWLQGPGGYTVVFGTGDLGQNGAHTPHEYVDVEDLDAHARAVEKLVCAFAFRAGSSPEAAS